MEKIFQFIIFTVHSMFTCKQLTRTRNTHLKHNQTSTIKIKAFQRTKFPEDSYQ
jgi:hypothetical protein